MFKVQFSRELFEFWFTVLQLAVVHTYILFAFFAGHPCQMERAVSEIGFMRHLGDHFRLD